MKKEIIEILTYMANTIGEIDAYSETWSAEYCKKYAMERHQTAIDALKKHLDWDNLTEQDCKELRFMRWSEDSKMYCIPIWLYKAIPVGTELISIGGERIVFDGNNIDNDTRFGCLAYGIIPKPDNDNE